MWDSVIYRWFTLCSVMVFKFSNMKVERAPGHQHHWVALGPATHRIALGSFCPSPFSVFSHTRIWGWVMRPLGSWVGVSDLEMGLGHQKRHLKV